MKRKNERGGEQELREKSKARMRKRNGKNFKDCRFFLFIFFVLIIDCFVVNFLDRICSLSC